MESFMRIFGLSNRPTGLRRYLFNPACQLTTTCNGSPTAFLTGTRNCCPSGLTSNPTITGARYGMTWTAGKGRPGAQIQPRFLV